MPTSSDNPTLRPAYGPLAALLVEMRGDWELDQVIRELVGCPWNAYLVLQAFLAARDDPSHQLRVRDAVIKIPSQQQQLTAEQYAAHREHAKRIIARRHGRDDA